MYGGGGALVTSPVGKSRADFHLFHATAAAGFKDWTSIGQLWAGQAGYSSLLATKPLAPPGEESEATGDYMVLFESGNATGAMYEVMSLVTFSLA